VPLYVDGFLLAVPKKQLATYRRIAKQASKIWHKHGALEYRECSGDDLKVKKGMGTSFPQQMKCKPGETVVFSWIVYKSKSHRNGVNAKVMKDPAIKKMMSTPMPFDLKRMLYGGFKVIVDA
jgi:uncharacterized protein YbaA (DUF1428 family)